MIKDLLNREIYGNYKSSWLSNRNVPDSLLETFQCTKSDKHGLLQHDLTECPGYQCRFCTVKGYNFYAMIAKEDGTVQVINTENESDYAMVETYQCHGNCIFDVQWLDHTRFLTSSGDSTIRMHDLQTKSMLCEFTGHLGSVKALTLNPDRSSCFASSSRDNSILLWDTRVNGKNIHNTEHTYYSPVQSLYSAHLKDVMEASCTVKTNKRKSRTTENGLKSVTSVIFVDSNTLVSCGSTDGKIKFWDIRNFGKNRLCPMKYIDYDKNNKERNPPGYTDLITNSKGTKLFAYCRDGFVYQYDLNSPDLFDEPEIRYSGHTANSFYLKMDLSQTDDGRFLACGSSSNSPYIYRVDQIPQKPLLLNGHRGEVTVCRWSPANPSVMVTISDDCTFMVHRMKPGSIASLPFEEREKRRHEKENTTGSLTSMFQDLVSISSRCSIETVNELNQVTRKPSIFSYVTPTKPETSALFNKSQNQSITTSMQKSFTVNKKLKTADLSNYFSPVSSNSFDNNNNNNNNNNKNSPTPSSRPVLSELNRSESIIKAAPASPLMLSQTRINRTSTILKSKKIPKAELIGRSASVCQKRQKRHDSNDENGMVSNTTASDTKENRPVNRIKRRKTIVNYPSIIPFVVSNNKLT